MNIFYNHIIWYTKIGVGKIPDTANADLDKSFSCCLCPCLAGAEGGSSPRSRPNITRQKATTLLLGPGLGYTAQSAARAAETRELVEKLLPGFGGSAVLGAGGLGDIAVRYGHQRGIPSVMWVTVVFLIILVQVVQLIFNWLSRRIDKRLDQPSGAKKSGPLDLLARFAHTKCPPAFSSFVS